jgi:citronellol/citronellal dehydrogenase
MASARWLEGRRAIVTGASRGIGAAVAARLAAYGGKVAAVAADLADDQDRARIVPEAVEQLGGPIDILVNNAAAAIYDSTLTYPLRRRRITFEVNVHAPLDLAQAAIPAMLERGEGWIVNLSSATARPAPGPPFRTSGVSARIGIYGASKAALNRETNALAVELYGRGVRVNTVEPRAAVLSEGADALVGDTLTPEQIEPMEAMVEATLALCRCGPERTGGVYVSLDLIDELGLEVRSLDGAAPHVGG